MPIHEAIRTIRGYAKIQDRRKYGRRSAEWKGHENTGGWKKEKEGRRREKVRQERSVGLQVGRISRLNITEYSFVSSSKLGYEGAAAVSCSLRLLLASSYPEFQYANFSPSPSLPCVYIALSSS